LLRLDSVSRTITAVLSGAVASTEADVVVCFTDRASQQPREELPSTRVTTTSGATPVTICQAPKNVTTREIDYVSIRNNDTASITVTIKYVDGSSSYKIITATLAVGESLFFTAADSWYVIDATGRKKEATAQGWTALVVSASGLVKTGRGTLFMVKCSSSSSGTVKLWDNTAASGTVIQDTMSIDAKGRALLPV
jgi:hypothetical protein